MTFHMTFRSTLLATGLFATLLGPCVAAEAEDVSPVPVLRADITVAGDVVRVGDFLDHAGTAARIALFRAPDLGTTGSVPTQQIIAALRAHQIFDVETQGISEVSVTRAARILTTQEIQTEVANALEHRNGLGDAANLAVTFDRDLRPLKFDPANRGPLRLMSLRFEPRTSRFDVTFEIANDQGNTPMKLRFTGAAIETVETTIVNRALERGEVIKASDVETGRRPKAEIGNDAVNRQRVIGMQLRRAIRAGQPLRVADLGKPDLVQRDQTVTLVYQMPGIYLTMRGKATESGTEGDTISVTNLQTKRIIQGVVVGAGQVSVTPAAPRPVTTAVLAGPVPTELASAANERASHSSIVVAAQKTE